MFSKIFCVFCVHVSLRVNGKRGDPSIFFSNYTFYLEIIVDSYAVVRTSTERSYVPFNQFLLMVMSSNTVIQHHSQDFASNKLKI